MSSLALDSLLAFHVVLSALLYLFDFVTNITTAIQYYHIDRDDIGTWQFFPAILVVMILGHVLNAVVFWLVLSPEQKPLLHAYFFPLVQFWRLVRVFGVTCTCRRWDNSLDSDIKPIYNILAVALEAGPQLLLQTKALYYLEDSGLLTRHLFFIRLSIIASLISAAYNGATAVTFIKKQSPLKGRIGVSAAGGLYVVASLALRAEGFGITAMYEDTTSYRFIVPLVIIGIGTNFAHIYFVSGPFREVSWKRLMECLALSCMSFTVGPLYAMLGATEGISDRRRIQKRQTRSWLHLEVCFACATHMLVDVGILVHLVVFDVGLRPYLEPCHGPNFKGILGALLQEENFDCNGYLATFIVGVILCIFSVMMFVLVDVHTKDPPHDHGSVQGRGQEEGTPAHGPPLKAFEIQTPKKF